jgi:hypothetical protein
MSEYTLDEKLEYAQERLVSAKAAVAAAERRGERASEMGGGIPGFGGSGNQRAARQVRAAHDSWMRAHAEASERVTHWTHKVRRYEHRIAERDRVRLTREDVVGAVLVRTIHGWHRVVRVNKTTVSVATGYSWTDRYEFDKVLEVRQADVTA